MSVYSPLKPITVLYYMAKDFADVVKVTDLDMEIVP